MTRGNLTMQFVWSFLEQGGSKAVQLVVQIILARILAPDLFGVLAIILVVANIADTLAQSGLASAIIQEGSDVDDDTYTTAFWLSMGLAVAIYVVVFVVAPVISGFYDMDELDLYLRVMSLIVFVNAANSIQRAHLQRDLDFKPLFRTTTIAVIISGVVGIAAALAGLGIWALILQAMSQSVVACIEYAFLVPWRPSLTFRVGQAKSLFAYGWKMCLTGILSTLCASISDLVIGKACTSEQLGYYSQGRKWPTAVISAATSSIQNVVFPALVRMRDDQEAFRAACAKALVAGSFVIAPFSFLLVDMAEPLIRFLLTDKWMPSVPIFQMICASYSVLMMELVNLRAYMALGDSDLYMRIHLVKLPIGIVLIGTAALVSQDIYVVAAVSSVYVVAQILFIDLAPAGISYGLGFARQIRLVAPIFADAVVAAAVIYPVNFFDIPDLVKLIIECCAYVVLYLGMARIFKVPGFSDALSAISKLLSSLHDFG